MKRDPNTILLVLVALAVIVVVFLAQKTHADEGAYDWPVVRVIDGDTVVVAALWLPAELGTEIAVRLHGVDSPESGWRAKCKAEQERGRAATAYVETLVASKKTAVIVRDWDKYGGRILGDIEVEGSSLTADLLGRDFVRPYTGSGAKPNWCE